MKQFIIEYWMEALFGLAIAGLSFCYRTLRNKLKQQEAIKEGVIAMLHDRLFQLGMDYISRNEISVSELQNYEALYVAYHNLGGNGTGTEIFERVKELPIKKGD